MYPIANRPVNAWATNYNTNYNTITYPEANRPVTAWTINYTTNYNVAYPIANQPESGRPATTYSTNYNIAYPIATQPIANQPITAYTPGTVGTPTTVLGVYLPGGPVSTVAPYVPATEVVYWSFPDYQTHPVSVPPGGYVDIQIE